MKKRRKKRTKKSILLWILLFVVISSFLLIQLISKKINPIILRYASIETKRFTTTLVNSSIDEKIMDEIREDLFTVTKNKNDEIQMIDFNTKEVNRLLNLIAEKIEAKLVQLEEGQISSLNVGKALKGANLKKLKKGIVCEIPVGVIFGNSLFANLGPTIPVRLSFLGQVLTHLNTKVESYGINNAYLELYVHIEVTERITMPTTTKEQIIKMDVPLTMKIIQGKVPNYFQSGFEENSTLYTLPKNKKKI